MGTRWLGVGLAAILAVVTLGLAVTGRLGLYINPESTWFAVSMSILVLIGTVASFALPLGAEADHGHDHGAAEPDIHAAAELDTHAAADTTGALRGAVHEHDTHPRITPGFVAAVAGGVVASTVVVCILVLPPASLSAELAMSRDTGAAPLFAGQDAVILASTGDTSSFGVGDWAGVFATATNPDAFAGDPVTLTGFATPAADGADGFQLTRLVITHCVIDAQPASIPVVVAGATPSTGEWVTVTGTVRSDPDGALYIDATSVESVPEPKNPYEY
ncbi:hypothetical protein ASD65_12980 [Microbacterium sp. Root61]|nr:hypothetical protein ASD65_12980 [Microbacterium sp. Root61]